MSTVDRRIDLSVEGRRRDRALAPPLTSATSWRRCWPPTWRATPRATPAASTGPTSVAAQGPRGPGPPLRRPLHQPPAGGGHASWPSSASTTSPWPPPCSTTRWRTPASPSADIATRLRARRGRHRRRRHQARPGPVRLQGGPAGRHHAQDARGHGQGHPGPADQAGRPAPQHAHDRRPARRQAARASPRRPLDVYAPLAHRLGIQDIKWQLEDLSFATLYPKRYAEIEQMVSSRAPERDIYLREVLEAVSATAWPSCASTPTSSGRPKHYWSIYEKMVVKGKEFDEIYDLVGDPGRRRPREGLLRRPRLHPRHVEAGAGAVQGLHRHAQVQPLPVAAHDGGGAPGQAGRGADPHPGDAPAGRVRHRRPLGLQGEPVPAGRPRLAASASSTGSRRRPTRRSSWSPEGRPRPGRGLRLHPQGRRRHPAGRGHRRRLRLRDPHRGRAPLHRRPGQRPAGAARLGADVGRHGRDLHLQGGGRRPVAGLAAGSSTPRARNKIRQWFSRERREDAIETGREELVKAHAPGGPARPEAGRLARSWPRSPWP